MLLKRLFNHRSSTGGGRSQNWAHILWREWRNCEDEEYARHLFDLLINNSTDWRATLVLILLGAIYGAWGGLLMTLLLYGENSNGGTIGSGVGLWVIVGSIGGLSIVLALRLGQWSSWDVWFQGLIPTRLLVSKPQDKFLNSLYLILIVGLSSGLGVGINGALFFGQSGFQYFNLIGGLFVGSMFGLLFNQLRLTLTTKLFSLLFMLTILCLGCIFLASAPVLFDSPFPFLFIGFLLEFFSARRLSLFEVLIGLLAGLFFGLFFGLGFAQFVGLLIGPLNALDSARVVGLAVGVGVGGFLGRGSGLIGVLVWQIILTPIVAVAIGLNLIFLSWLFGLFVGGIMGSLSQIVLPERRLQFAEAYKYRKVYLWWCKRPFATEVESALHSLATGDAWAELLRRLAEHRKQPEGTTILRIAALESTNWVDRFIAWHILVHLGGQALPHLLPILNTFSGRPVAAWLLRSIGYETKIRLAERADCLLCPECLTYCGPRSIRQPGLSMTYYGCRTCGQSRQFLYCPQGVIAVLGTASSVSAQNQHDGLLRVNWLTRRTLFDFNQVEIIQATDEDIERFAVQVGNDTDPVRQPRYAQMQCFIASQCRLSENSLRVLQIMFGQVEKGEVVVISGWVI